METLRRIIQRVRQQLSVMTRSQQIAIALCAVVIMGSLLWMMKWSATPEMEPLIDQPMTAQQMHTAIAVLDTVGAPYMERGDRVLVLPSDRQRLLHELETQNALPQDISLGFENLLKNESPFQPESINRRNFLIALQNELATVIAINPNVRSARVFINAKEQRRIGPQPSLQPTASVDIVSTRGQSIDDAGVQAAANLVAAAVAGMEPHNVSVNVDGRPRKVPSPEESVGFALLSEKVKNEKHFEGKIHDLLSYITGVKIAVSVELDGVKTQMQETSYTSSEIKSESKQTDEMLSGQNAAESGVGPNTGVALTGGDSGNRSSKDQEQNEYYEPKVAQIKKSEAIPFGVTKVAASINIPRSYFVNVFRAANGKDANPDDTELSPLIESEKSRVRVAVGNLIGSIDDDAVRVDWFPDVSPDSPGQWVDSSYYAGLAPIAGAEAQGSFVSYAPQLGMVGLALVSLAMMFMLVRKSTRVARTLLPDVNEEEAGNETRNAIENAGLTDGMLIGQEIDADTLRLRNLGEQVSQMIEDDPDTAADLLRRWIVHE